MPTGVYKRKKMPIKERRAKNALKMKQLYASSPEYRDQQKNNKLMKAYGITFEQYQAWNHEFNGVCHICDKPCPSKRRLAVDHEHSEQGLVRGLLCIKCNKGLGNFCDDIELMEKAIQYLKDFEQTKLEVASALNQIRL